MNHLLYNEGAGERGGTPFPNRRRPASALLRSISLDDSEHLLLNHQVSVASLRLLFTFAFALPPE